MKDIKILRYKDIKKKGFTLIELLVTISIIGILVSFGAAKYITSEKQARDTQRKSDLAQYRIALENYATVNGSLYPLSDATGKIGTLCTNLGNFIASCLHDPRTTPDYLYFVSADRISWVLGAALETGGYWEICANGKSGKISSAPTDSSCDL